MSELENNPRPVVIDNTPALDLINVCVMQADEALKKFDEEIPKLRKMLFEKERTQAVIVGQKQLLEHMQFKLKN